MAETKTFTHPLDPFWLSMLEPGARILDYGCGYGRTLAELARLGFRDAVGMDPSPAMIARGRREHPALDLALTGPLPDAAFDAALLLAVLTCVADDAAQAAIVATLHRTLRPGGWLLVSDMERQADARNLSRYRPDGTFTTDDGTLVRHHPPGHFARLLVGFEVAHRREVRRATMNGHTATAVQIAVRRG